MFGITHVLFAVASWAALASTSLAGSPVLFDQIGPSPSFLAGSSSSSQFNPTTPDSVFATVDDFTIGGGSLVQLTSFEAVVTGLQNFVSFNLVQSWNVQIFSSLDAASHNVTGDVYSATFRTPSAITSGYANIGGQPNEIATFDINAVLQPGEYWIELTMGNDATVNGTVGIRHSLIGDGPCYFAVPAQGTNFALTAPAAYRLYGDAVPAPGTLAVTGLALLGFRRRRRS